MTKRSSVEYSYRSLVFRATGVKTAVKRAQVRKSLTLDVRKTIHKRLLSLIKEIDKGGVYGEVEI
jgi:hypothetical protein